MTNKKHWEIIVGITGFAFLLFSVVQMFLEANYDIWLFTNIVGSNAAQLCLIMGLLLITIYLFLLYYRNRKIVVLVLFCILMAVTLFEMFAFVNILLIMRTAPI